MNSGHRLEDVMGYTVEQIVTFHSRLSSTHQAQEYNSLMGTALAVAAGMGSKKAARELNKLEKPRG